MAFVQTQGRLAGLDSPPAPAGLSIRVTDDYSTDYATIYREHKAVRMVVSFLAENIASLGMHLFKRKGDTERERISDHPVATMLTSPSKTLRTTRYSLMYGLVSDLAIFDRAAALKIMADDGSLSMIRLPVAKIVPTDDDWLTPKAFKFSTSTGVMELPADQVVYIHGYNPDSLIDGVSPIESLRVSLAEDHNATTARSQMLKNGARVSGYLERPASSPWSAEARKRFADSWKRQYAGGGPESGGTPILEDGMTFKPATQTSKDLEYIGARKLTTLEVAQAYHVPPPMLGILDQATFSNISEQHKMLYADTLGPWLVWLKEELELQLLSDFPDTADMYLEFNLEAKLRGSFEEQATGLQTSVGAPWMTRNEARARLNLPPVDNGDELITPLNVLEGDQASPTDSVPDDVAP